MNTIPWYRSHVFTAGLLAFVTEVASILDSQLLSGKFAVLGHSIAALLMAIVVTVRAMANAQPITLTQGDADEANAVAVEKRQKRQGGYARPLLLALLFSTAVLTLPVLQGCAALGIEQPQSFNQRYAYALGQITAVRLTAAKARHERQISVEDGEYVLRLTDQSRQLLEAARSVADLGDITNANGQLALVTSVLTQVQAYLNARAPR